MCVRPESFVCARDLVCILGYKSLFSIVHFQLRAEISLVRTHVCIHCTHDCQSGTMVLQHRDFSDFRNHEAPRSSMKHHGHGALTTQWCFANRIRVKNWIGEKGRGDAILKSFKHKKNVKEEKEAAAQALNFINWGRAMTMLVHHHADAQTYSLIATSFEILGYRTRTEDLGIPIITTRSAYRSRRP